MTTIQGLVINDSGFIEKVTHSGSAAPTSFATKSPKIRWDEVKTDVMTNSNADITRASAFSTRVSRPRISNKRSRPYQDTATRSSSHSRAVQPCRYFQAGNCTNGETCRFRHLARSTSPESDLDQELRAFIGRDDAEHSPPSGSPKSVPNITYNPDDFPDEEELYEIVSTPSSTISEVRFNTRSNPGEIRTYFVAQRQPVVEYEGNNVGILSGGVLLGVPSTSRSASSTSKVEEYLEDVTESETASSSSPSPTSNDSNHELWKGPVSFEESAAETESLVWADDVDDTPMGAANFGFNGYSMTSIPEVPSPPPVLRRIIRQVDLHNRRHSLS